MPFKNPTFVWYFLEDSDDPRRGWHCMETDAYFIAIGEAATKGGSVARDYAGAFSWDVSSRDGNYKLMSGGPPEAELRDLKSAKLHALTALYQRVYAEEDGLKTAVYAAREE